MDVIQKNILRMLRRFFHRLFLQRSQEISQKGFCNLHFADLQKSMENFLVQIGFGIDQNDQIDQIERNEQNDCNDQNAKNAKNDKNDCNGQITQNGQNELRNVAIFLLKIFRRTTKDTLEGTSAPFRDSAVINEAMTKYTRAKFTNVIKCEYFQKCLKFVYEGTLADNTSTPCLDHLLATESKCIKGNKDKYLETLKGLYQVIVSQSG